MYKSYYFYDIFEVNLRKRLYFHSKAELIHPLFVTGSQVKRRAMAPKNAPAEV
jgi:hypothetical protein